MAGTVATGAVVHRSRGLVRTDVTITCDGSGVLTATPIAVGYGRLVNVFYNGGLATSAVINLTDTKSGANLIGYTAGSQGTAVMFRPTTAITDNAGAAVAAAASAPNVNRDLYLGGKVSLGVTSGGAAGTGIVSFIIDESDIAPRPLS